ncbi:DUF58 domain-containing protein [Evansella tamaricis]|uniref:DUF58 domain-containing protein n=1 Tax=Evansella tamaricis TaxID=2069301 RepID=A0ABS6JI95_9BACI|nr:DUF58 domain-containing protein [Evansella tamaricis]MBU9713404.1 DUF58 domain-containing protein [Evansella tamaricis]
MGVHWIIITTVFMVIAQAYIFKKWGLNKIEYSRYFFDKAVFEGEETEMVEEIINKKFLPIPWLRLESKISSNLVFKQQDSLSVVGEQFHRSFFSLMTYQKIRRRHKITCTKRGYYQLKTVSISVGDPFGIDKKSKTLHVSSNLLVYPRFLPMEEIPLPSNSWQGDILVRRWIMDDPFIFAGVREYTYGDTMKSVNWSATARIGALQVSKKDFTADHNLMIYLNFDQTEDIWKEIEDKDMVEKGISYAASIAQYTISNGIPTGFGCNSYLDDPSERIKRIKNSVRIEGMNGNNHLTHILQTMAMLRVDRSMNFGSFLQEDVDQRRTNTDIILITAFISETIQKHIRSLEALGNSVEIIYLTNSDQGEIMSESQEGDYYANY